jgi:N-acetylglucosamine kinase-like BadF-type ATPase
MLAGGETGSSISNARGDRSTDQAIEWILSVIESQPDDDVCAWIGAAGFSASTSSLLEDRFRERLDQLRERFDERGRHCEIFIANDGVSLLKSPPLNGQGLAAIVGTGSVVMGAHPACPDGVIKRGGYEWVVSDEGSGVWMTLESVRILLKDIQERGPKNYHSALLDRLSDHLGIPNDAVDEIAASHRALGKIDLVARRVAENRTDAKRFLASFVYPNIFDLAHLRTGHAYDALAAEVLNSSVDRVVHNIATVSDALAAHTADEPNDRESFSLLIGGNIAANSTYEQRLRDQIAGNCRFVSSVEAIGDAAHKFASLALRYLKADGPNRRAIVRSFDPLHTVLKLM